MLRGSASSSRWQGAGPPAAAAAAASSSSSSDRVPSWVLVSLSYSVLLLHFGRSYLLLHAGPTHFAALRVLLLAVNGVYVLAFRSFALQADGLLAPRTGLLPLDRQLQQLQQLQQLPASVPVSFVLSVVGGIAKQICRSSETFQLSHLSLLGACCAALNLSLSLLLPPGLTRCLWETGCCCLQFVLYLSIRYFAREFMAFQWDVLLLECGFICCLGPVALGMQSHFAVTAVILMLRLLLFKLLFSSAVSKCFAAAPRWRDFSALHFHYWTQPLPNPGSWYAYWSRGKQLQAAAVLFIEAVASFSVFGGASLRVAGLVGIAGLSVGVLLTGNVGFLAHLTLALSLCLLDDLLLGIPAPPAPSLSFLQRFASMSGSLLICCLVGAYFLIYSIACLHYFCKAWLCQGVSAPSWVLQLCKELSLLCACNAYGLFSVVTTGRSEVVIEELRSTKDAKPQWKEIHCAYKPGDVDVSPPWLLLGHFPRLDWRLWFVPLRLRAALASTIEGRQLQQEQGLSPAAAAASAEHAASVSPSCEANKVLYPPFWETFLQQLAARRPALLQLLGQQGKELRHVPPPKALRVSLYDYRLRPPEGLPLHAAFFPQGWAHLTPQEVLKLEDELKHWTVGRWWLRRHQQTLDVLSFAASQPAA